MEELDNVNVDSKRAKKKEEKKSIANALKLQKISKKKKSNEKRLNRRADRLAARKGFEGTGKFYTNSDGMLVPDNQGGKFLEARAKARKLMKDRRARGKQFFVDMAKNLGGIDNAYETKPLNNPMTADEFMAKLGIMNKKSDVITDTNTSEQINATNAATENLKQDDNTTLTDFSYDRGTSGLSGPYKIEDSTPTTYMQKEYRKKRGY
jgi:hypothetical protein